MGSYYHIVCLDCKEYAVLRKEGWGGMVYEECPEGMTEEQVKKFAGSRDLFTICYFIHAHPGHRLIICTSIGFDFLNEKEWVKFQDLFPREDIPDTIGYKEMPPFDDWSFPLKKHMDADEGKEVNYKDYQKGRMALRERFNHAGTADRELAPYYDQLQNTLQKMRETDRSLVEQLGLMNDRIIRIHNSVRESVKELHERMDALEQK